MLKIKLNSAEKELLHKSKSRNDIPTNRIFAILLAGEGMSAIKISEILNLNADTIRGYMKSYLKGGVDGLVRSFSTGRPSDKKSPLIDFLKICLISSPCAYGWDKATWDSTSIIDSFEKESGILVSHDTVTRAMKELGYSYKKPQKSPCARAPSKEEKLNHINDVISLIINDLNTGEAEIYATDESHFTNEPYLPRGYFLKGRESVNSYSKKKGNKKPIWVIKSTNWKVFLESN